MSYRMMYITYHATWGILGRQDLNSRSASDENHAISVYWHPWLGGIWSVACVERRLMDNKVSIVIECINKIIN